MPRIPPKRRISRLKWFQLWRRPKDIPSPAEIAQALNHSRGELRDEDFDRFPGYSSYLNWALVSLFRHERRVQWAAGVARATPKRLEEEDSGRAVPGEPGWRFRWIYPGWWLEHESGGLVSFPKISDNLRLGIHPLDYAQYLDSSGNLELPEKRFRPNAAFPQSWQYDLEGLKSRELLVSEWPTEMTNRGRKIASPLNDFAREIERLISEESSESRRRAAWMTAWLGDMPLAAKLSEGSFPILSQRLAILAGKQVCVRASEIQSNLPRPEKSIFVILGRLESLACLGRAHAKDAVHQAFLRNSREEGSDAALSVIDAWAMDEDVPILIQGLSQAEPTMERGIPGLDVPDLVYPDEMPLQIASALLKICDSSTLPAQARELILRRLSHGYFANYPQAAALLYLFDTKIGLGRLIQDLHEPSSRVNAACYLAIISTSEAIASLIEHAKHSENGYEVACALSHIPNEEAQRAAEEWKAKVGHLPDPLDVHQCSAQQLERYFTLKQVAGRFETLQKQYHPLLQRWAHKSNGSTAAQRPAKLDAPLPLI